MLRGLLTVGAVLVLWSGAAPAQSVLDGVNLQSPAMTEAEMTRDDVLAAIRSADGPPDFTRKKLNGIDLSGIDFRGAILRAARLNGTNLAGANLDGAILSQGWFIGADLSGASMKGAEMFSTQFTKANLSGADMSGSVAAADFTKANLEGASFRGANLAADMKNQSMGLMRGVLTNADANGADFTGAMMNRAEMEFASLRGADFTGADLSMTTMGAADLTGATVTGAVFTDADVTSTKLLDLVGAEDIDLSVARNHERAFTNR